MSQVPLKQLIQKGIAAERLSKRQFRYTNKHFKSWLLSEEMYVSIGFRNQLPNKIVSTYSLLLLIQYLADDFMGELTFEH